MHTSLVKRRSSVGELDSGPSETAVFFSGWERSWSWTERWIPHVLLAVSTLVVVTAPDQSTSERAATLGLVVVAEIWISVGFTFAPLERRQEPGYAFGYVAGLLVLAALLLVRDPIFFVFAITGFLHSSMLRPRLLVFVGTGATSFLILAMTWEGGFPQPTLEGNAGFLTVFVLQTVLIALGTVGGEALHDITEERRQALEQLRATVAENEGLQSQLVSQAREAGVVDERQRLAREIHDTLAQGLAGIITQLEAAAQTDDRDALRGRLDTATRLARESLQEARRSVHALRPGSLERGRLADALGDLVEDWSQLSGVAAQLRADGEAGARLPIAVEVALVRVAQEALANVAKHADATRVGVTLSSWEDRVVLDVRDDGRGFDPSVVATDRAGFGLTSMRQRVEDLGGSLAVESPPGSGTAISASIPLPATEVADA